MALTTMLHRVFRQAIPFSFVASAILLTIAACGGGSGGGATTPLPPPPPSSGGQVIITMSNAADVAAVGASLTEGSTQLALAVVNSVIELYNSNSVQFTRTCASGTLELVLDDSDSNSAISPGDDIAINYLSDCVSSELNDPASGTMNAHLSDVSFGPGGNLYLAGSVSIPNEFVINRSATESVAVTGALAFVAITRGSILELLRVDVVPADNLQFVISANSAQLTEQITALSMQRAVEIGFSQDGPYTLKSSASFVSALAGGSLWCGTVSDLASASANDMPTAGQFDCVGASGSTARLETENPSAFSEVDLQVDPEGDGSFVSVTNFPNGPPAWLHFVEGQLFTGRLRDTNSLPYQPPPSLTPVTLTMDVKDLTYSSQSDELLATTATGILRIDQSTLVVTETVNVSNNPGALALSDDETVLWVALDDSSQLQRFTYPQLVAGAVSPLGDYVLSSSGPREAAMMSVAPASTDLVVLSTSNPIELVSYDSGVQLPDIISNGRAGSFVFRDEQNIVAVDGATTAQEAYRILLDPVSGLTLIETYPGLASQSKDRPSLGTDHVFLSGSRVINETTESIEAFIDSNTRFNFFYNSIVVDTSNNEIYAISHSRRKIDLFSENNFIMLGRYDIPSGISYGAIHATITPDHLIFVRQGVVESYLRSDIQPNTPTDPCLRLDLSDTLIDGTYVTLSCSFTDAVYDVVRDRIYAGLGSYGARGNSVAIINPATLEIDNYIPVGGRPVDFQFSADNSLLYAILESTSKVIAVDLDTRMITGTTLLGFGTDAYVAGAIAPTTQSGGEFVAAVNRDVALYGNGAAIGTIANGFKYFNELFVTDDGATAIAKFSNDVGIHSVSVAGVSMLSSQNDLIHPDPVERRENFLYAANGARLEMGTLAIDQPCSLPPELMSATRTRSGPDFQSDLVYYAAMDIQNINSETVNYVACDPTTQTTGAMQSPIAFQSDDGQVTKVLPVSGGKIAVVTETQVILLDRPTL